MLNICICQLIKDEQRYIEEWIDYYLNLGISKFVLFEDWNSSSHADVLSKYGDKIILHKLYEVATEEEIKSMKRLRQEIAWKCFYRLYKDKFDACLFIDPDEFLTCETKEDFIGEIEYLISNTDMKVLRYVWCCMTASGRIKDPAPNNKYSVVNTYNQVYENPKSELNLNCKCLIILNRSDESTFNNRIPHGPYEYDWVHYSRFLLRHYLTKSWEEYKWRLYVKGEQTNSDFDRKIEHFFEINKDLLPYKEQLLKECEGLEYKYNDYN